MVVKKVKMAIGASTVDLAARAETGRGDHARAYVLYEYSYDEHM
jgi:hypothetical protein